MLYRHSAHGQTFIWGSQHGTASDTIGEVWVVFRSGESQSHLPK
jgi:hypothetical protein